MTTATRNRIIEIITGAILAVSTLIELYSLSKRYSSTSSIIDLIIREFSLIGVMCIGSLFFVLLGQC